MYHWLLSHWLGAADVCTISALQWNFSRIIDCYKFYELYNIKGFRFPFFFVFLNLCDFNKGFIKGDSEISTQGVHLWFKVRVGYVRFDCCFFVIIISKLINNNQFQCFPLLFLLDADPLQLFVTQTKNMCNILWQINFFLHCVWYYL